MTTSIVCYYSVGYIGYSVVSLILLMVVSFIAMLFEIYPVLLAAILSAIIWNFFFIPPVFTFHIDSAEDVLMFSLYFIIASVNAVLTFKIRKAEKKYRDKVEKENTIKLYNTLLNSLSHELRTPISTIVGAIDTLRENGDKISPKNQAELLNEIDIASIRLNRQVDNLLNMSRLEAGVLKPKLDWCDANELVFKIINDSRVDFQNHTIIFVANENLPLFKLDRGLVEQIIYNLLHNAAQHTPKGSELYVDIRKVKRNCVIEITDTGTGFPAKEIPFVFEKFYRLAGSKTGGTGLGLSIVKGFTEAMKGTIQLQNSEQGGAKFIIEIPAETSSIKPEYNE